MTTHVFPVQGYRGEVLLHWGQVRGGSDLFAPSGTPVVAMTDGSVAWAGWGDVGGWNVTLAGDDGLVYYYAHLDRQPAVATGQRVAAGQYLAGVGDTGNATQAGPHLHIGIGPEIVRGTGPYGGTGGDYDAVGLLRAALAGGGTGGQAMVAIPGFDFDVALDVIEEAGRQGLPPLLLLSLAHGEGGLSRPFPRGDGGKSRGPFQVYTEVHGTGQDWEDPITAIRYLVTAAPRGGWKATFAAAGGWKAWWYDHYAFIERWAPVAQGSVAWTADKARQCVGHAFDTYVLVMRELVKRAGGGVDPAVEDLRRQLRELQDLCTLQATALEETAGTLEELGARATVQAQNLRSAVSRGAA